MAGAQRGVFNTYIKDPGPWDKIYRTAFSEHFAVVAAAQQDVVADITTLGENFRRIAMSVLGTQRTADPLLGYVVIVTHEMQTAYDYLAPLGVDARHIAGVCFGGPGGHIVMHDRTRFNLRLTFIYIRSCRASQAADSGMDS